MELKIYSGGQKGIDEAALKIAKECGFETGGTAPKYWRTEDGPNPTLKDFGLVQSSSDRYEPRTERNIIDSNGTVIFGSLSSPGSKTTLKFIDKHKKEYITNPTPEKLIEFIKINNIKILNVAGNRKSRLTNAELTKYENILRETFKILKNGIDQ